MKRSKMVSSSSRVIALYSVAFLMCQAAAVCLAQEALKVVEFQGQRWVEREIESVFLEKHLGRDSLRFLPANSEAILQLEGNEFRHGVIHLEVARNGGRLPQFAFCVDGKNKDFDRITLNPVPYSPDQVPRRLKQLIVTPGEYTSVVATVRVGENTGDESNPWFGVKIDVGEELIKITIDDDDHPCIVFANLLHHELGSGIGISGNGAFFRSIRVTSKGTHNRIGG